MSTRSHNEPRSQGNGYDSIHAEISREMVRLYKEKRFREIVERVTGRKVRAFVSGIDADVDICAEIFYLESRQEPERGFGSPPPG